MSNATPGAAASSRPGSGRTKFTCAYAPHFGMFRNLAGDDSVRQLEYAAEQGFTAWEDNGMGGRSVDEQKRIASAMSRLGMRMGVFVCNPATAWDYSFTRRDAGLREKFLDEVRQSVETAKRVNATWMTVVPGNFTTNLEWDYQTANVIDSLKRCAEIFEALRRQRMTE